MYDHFYYIRLLVEFQCFRYSGILYVGTNIAARQIQTWQRKNTLDKSLSIYKYENIDEVICENRDEGSFIWENFYDEQEQINEYDLTIFIREKSGLYRKYEETHYQRGYSIEKIRTLIEQAGMECLAVYEAGTKEAPGEESERIYFIAKERGK